LQYERDIHELTIWGKIADEAAKVEVLDRYQTTK